MKGIIAVPTSSHFYLLKKFALDLMELRLVFDKFYSDNTFIFSEYAWLEDARNVLWGKAKNINPDWMLWLDSDMTFTPKDGLKLVQYIQDGYDFVTGLYFAGAQPHMPLIYKEFYDERIKDLNVTYYHDFPKENKNFIEIDGCGLGFFIVSKKVIEKIEEGAFNRLESWCGRKLEVNRFDEGLSFCRRVKDTGFKMYCDTDIELGHIRLSTIDKEYLDSGQMFKMA